jgi:lysophosphatidylcholine acyltransferase/lyso-PAF acetyltransferase
MSVVTVVPSATKEEVDPFVYDYSKHQPCLQVVKMVLVGVILFPIRGVVLLLSFFLFWLTAFIGSVCMSDVRAVQFPQTKPVSRFFLRVFARMILWSLGYWWISVDGEFDERAKVIVSNHCSFVDPFFFTYALLPMAVAKAELFNVPMLGSIAKIVQAIPVSRSTAESRHDVSHEIKRRTQWGLPKDQHREDPAHPSSSSPEEEDGTWPPLLIFPEATCTNTRSIIQFKLGAFAPRVPIQPVAIDFRQENLDVSWPGDAPVGMTILRMMCQVYNTLHVTYLPLAQPLSPAETVPEFASRVQHAIAAALKIPVTQHSFTPPARPASARRQQGSAAAAATAETQQPQQDGAAVAVEGRGVPYGSPEPRPGAVHSQQTGKAEEHELESEESIPELVRSCSLVP